MNDAKGIRARIDKQTAWGRLHRFQRVASLRRMVFRRLARTGPSFKRSLPFLEMVWLPYYHVVFEVTDAQRVSEVEMLISGHNGSCSLLKAGSLDYQSLSDQETLCPDLSRSDAERVAREKLTPALSQQVGGKACLGNTTKVELLHRPFWVYYFERRRDRLDVKLMDAWNGSVGGGQMKAAFIKALSGSG